GWGARAAEGDRASDPTRATRPQPSGSFLPCKEGQEGRDGRLTQHTAPQCKGGGPSLRRPAAICFAFTAYDVARAAALIAPRPRRERWCPLRASRVAAPASAPLRDSGGTYRRTR